MNCASICEKNIEIFQIFFCCGISSAIYIGHDHHSELQSPYTGEPLEEEWEEEFGDLTLQVCFDILLTACYDVEDDMGLGYLWDAVNEVVGALDVFEEPQIAVLGREVEVNGVLVCADVTLVM